MALPYLPKPQNMKAFAVKTAQAATDVVVLNGQLQVSGISARPLVKDILSVTKTVSVAETPKVMRMDLTGVATADIVTTQAYSITLFPEGTGNTYGQGITTTFFASAATTTAFATSMYTALAANDNNDAYFTFANGTAGKVDITGVALTAGQFEIDYFASAAVVTVTTSYVRPSGTLTDIAQYTSTAPSTGTAFTKYVVEYLDGTISTAEGKIQYVPSSFVVFANEAATAADKLSFDLAMMYKAGTILQATNNSTGVTCNSERVLVQMQGAAIAPTAAVEFTLTDSSITTSTVYKTSVVGGLNTAAVAVAASNQAAGAGSIKIDVANISTVVGAVSTNGAIYVLVEKI